MLSPESCVQRPCVMSDNTELFADARIGHQRVDRLVGSFFEKSRLRHGCEGLLLQRSPPISHMAGLSYRARYGICRGLKKVAPGRG